MMFNYSICHEWPPLAWIAKCTPGNETLHISHGQLVETNDKFFCEAVWDGPFNKGDLDQTDIVAGSGGRKRGNKITFVSSGSTCDRLVFIRDQDSFWISNSLVCLLYTIDAEVSLFYKYYHNDFFSIVHGIDKYKKTLETSNGDVRLVYFDNIVWDGNELLTKEKPRFERDFSRYANYVDFLQCSMDQISINSQDPARKATFSLITSLSSGYDSSAVATLARNAGCKDALSITRCDADDPDDGRIIADVLDLRQHIIDRNAWVGRQDGPEPTFMAVDAKGEDRYYASAEPILNCRVLTSGYHGDKIWGKTPKDKSDQIVRGDTSGLSLTEFRLKAGFIHCPVPFWGVRQIEDVVRLSHSDEMKPYDMPGWYSRPICRRIVENAGVPREAFGRKKAMASIQNHGDRFLSNNSTKEYLKWLKAHRWILVSGAKFPIIISPLLDDAVCKTIVVVERISMIIRKQINRRKYLWRLRNNQLIVFLANLKLNVGPLYLRRYNFPWAVCKTKALYAHEVQTGNIDTGST